MTNVVNLSPFSAIDFPSLTKDGEETLVICIAGRFDLPKPGNLDRQDMRPSEEQLPPPTEDVYWGEPGLTSLRYEGQTAYVRPGTDIYLNGQAWARRGRPVHQMDVRLQVGSCRKVVRIFGDRRWIRGILRLRPSTPQPFESMPLVYERSFGGIAQPKGAKPPSYEPRNPVGRGFYDSRREARHQPLPNLEDPARLITRWTDRPFPAGFGPIARNWQPRLGYAGTYDDPWVENRAPLWPLNFDVRFFQAAPAELVVQPFLTGGEPVRLEGCSPDGAFAFTLPRYRLLVKSTFHHRVDRRLAVLDAVRLEPDEGTLTLIWRATIPTQRELALHEFTSVRELEVWEDFPAMPDLAWRNGQNGSRHP